MMPTKCCKCSWSTSQAATTWQSLCARKAWVLEVPMFPQPTIPRARRWEGAGFPPRPNTLAGMIVGRARAAPVAARKWRRQTFELGDVGFILRMYQGLSNGVQLWENGATGPLT